MVRDEVGLPKLLPFLRESGNHSEVGRVNAQEAEWGKESPELSVSLVLLLALLVQGLLLLGGHVDHQAHTR